MKIYVIVQGYSKKFVTAVKSELRAMEFVRFYNSSTLLSSHGRFNYFEFTIE